MTNFLLRSGFSIRLIALLVGALLLPVLLAVIVFPTPLYDTRELIAWGRQFPIATPYHPPVMVWIGGAVDLLVGRSAAATILVGQLLQAVGLIYVYLTLCLVTERRMAAFSTVLFGSSFYVVFGPLSWALNADILQLTSWPAVLYHFLRAYRTDRWTHWILFGLWSALAALTKYNAVILFLAMAIGIVWLPAFRTILKRPGPHVALAIGGLIFLPHAIAVLHYGSTVAYGMRRFSGGVPVVELAKRISQIPIGYLLFLAPGWIVVAIALWQRRMVLRLQRFGKMPDEMQFLLVINIAMICLLLCLVGLFGLDYIFRYGAPFVELAAIALAPLVVWVESRREIGERDTVRALGLVYLTVLASLCVGYTFFFSHSGLQEPTAAAARVVMADWNSKYACGPAYMLGDRQTVYGVGIEAGASVAAISVVDVPDTPWFDASKLTAQGAVVIYGSPGPYDAFARLFPRMAVTPEMHIAVPVLRTHSGKVKDYFYSFVPPQNCNR